MLISYSDRSGTIETIYTYEEWPKEYNHLETKQRTRQRIEHLYYIKPCILGGIMVACGILVPFVLDGDATISLFALPFGIFLMATWEKVMLF